MLFKLPLRAMVAAPSQSGKSYFIIELLKRRKELMIGKIDNIIWVCANKMFVPKEAQALPDLKIIEGLPVIESIPHNTLLVLDDLQMSNLKDICTLFTVSSHHKNISAFFLVQNLFFSNPYMRTISLNCSHFVLFKSLRDINQIQYFAQQVFPDCKKAFMRVFKEVTKPPFAYLIIDVSQSCCPILKIKTDVLNNKYFEAYSTESDYESQKFVEKSKLFDIPYTCIENFLM